MINVAKSMTLRAPISGRIIPLERVANPVFSKKGLGNGIAIEPADGKIYAPVDAQITSVVEEFFSFGLSTDTGLELLLHVELDAAALRPGDFVHHVREGEYVRAGQLIAEVDRDMLRRKRCSATTILLVCSDPNQWKLFSNMGEVMGGKTPALILKDDHTTEKQPMEESNRKETYGILQRLRWMIRTSKMSS